MSAEGNEYEITIDLSKPNNSHTFIGELVGRNKRVLDVGAATGYMAEALSERGCVVTGIELDPGAASKAEQPCEKVIVGDVESLDLQRELDESTFDVVVLGDVLEHLKEPLQVIRKLRSFLSPGGYVVASIPNIAHGSVRLALMQGEFQYRPLGLLDDTHLKFFTRESVEELFDEAGYVIAGMERTQVGIFETEIKVDREQFTQEVLDRIREDPEVQTYQFVLAAYPAENTGVVAKLSDRLGEKEKELLELRRRLSGLEPAQERKQRRIQKLSAELNALKSLRKSPSEEEGEGDNSESSEAAYNRLAVYGFASRYVQGKNVACISSEDVGFGAHRLAKRASSVAALSDSEEALEQARETYPTSNASFEHAHLPGIPYSSGHFDVVIVSGALERMQHPEELIKESKRVLGEDGVLLLSTPDRQKHSNERNHQDPAHNAGLYVSELKEMLEKHFGAVSIRRQGAVAGGMIFGESGDLETAALSFDGPPPETSFVLAVCGPHDMEDGSEEPQLLLGFGREIFDEHEDQREDIELLKAEIAQMQRIEVQAFRDTLKRRNEAVSDLNKQLKNVQNELDNSKAEANNLKNQLKNVQSELDNSKAEANRLKKSLNDIENSRSWRVLGLYRQARFAINGLRKKS